MNKKFEMLKNKLINEYHYPEQIFITPLTDYELEQILIEESKIKQFMLEYYHLQQMVNSFKYQEFYAREEEWKTKTINLQEFIKSALKDIIKAKNTLFFLIPNDECNHLFTEIKDEIKFILLEYLNHYNISYEQFKRKSSRIKTGSESSN